MCFVTVFIRPIPVLCVHTIYRYLWIGIWKIEYVYWSISNACVLLFVVNQHIVAKGPDGWNGFERCAFWRSWIRGRYLYIYNQFENVIRLTNAFPSINKRSLISSTLCCLRRRDCKIQTLFLCGKYTRYTESKREIERPRIAIDNDKCDCDKTNLCATWLDVYKCSRIHAYAIYLLCMVCRSLYKHISYWRGCILRMHVTYVDAHIYKWLKWITFIEIHNTKV